MSNPLHSCKSDSWYTPAKWIRAVRAVLGTIDLDPASCEEANIFGSEGCLLLEDGR